MHYLSVSSAVSHIGHHLRWILNEGFAIYLDRPVSDLISHGFVGLSDLVSGDVDKGGPVMWAIQETDVGHNAKL